MEAIVRACARRRPGRRKIAAVDCQPSGCRRALRSRRRTASPRRWSTIASFADRDSFDAALAEAIDSFAPDLVVLAGFMRVLTDGFVDHYAGRMLNVHPSLLPSFPGLKTHQQALDAGVRVHGATVHFVTSQLDHGPIVAQAAVPVDDRRRRRHARRRACWQSNTSFIHARCAGSSKGVLLSTASVSRSRRRSRNGSLPVTLPERAHEIAWFSDWTN